MKTFDVTAFICGEGLLVAEASSLGYAPGEVPERVKVTNARGCDADFSLEATFPEGWKLKLTGFGVPIEESDPEYGPSLWICRHMVILND